MKNHDAIIIGGGAAGMMAAIEAGKRGRKVLVLERGSAIGNKILISGGGRCNFTNMNARPENYISANPHFMRSAFSRYSPQDFISLVESHGVEYYEKKLGQLFCRRSSREIIAMLLKEADQAGVEIETDASISKVEKSGDYFSVRCDDKVYTAEKLVIACGGLSFPKKGATDFGYRLARQFGHSIISTRPGLVPLTLPAGQMSYLKELSGISFDSEVIAGKSCFRENVLITHRGLSGPAILQASSYWHKGNEIEIAIEPSVDFREMIEENANPKTEMKTLLSEKLPGRLASALCEMSGGSKPLQQYNEKELSTFLEQLKSWRMIPSGTEGYEKAEVTIGGVDTDGLNQRTMGSKLVQGLYFVGEVIDVTGWLGGYNFQWAWASGFACGNDL